MMLKRLSYKNTCYLLFTGLVIFLFAGYRLTFADTFTLMTQIREKQKKLDWLTEKEKELPALRSKMQEFEKAYSNNDSTSVRDKLTACISDFAEQHHCLVTEIPVNSSFRNENLHVQTNTFTIRGNFNTLVQLLYHLENDYKYITRIMSARYFTTRDPSTKKKQLYLTIITQSFEQNTR